MLYTVINDFIEKEHNNEIYRKGETYPKDSHKAATKRVALLRAIHSDYGVAFLGNELKVEEAQETEVKKPQVTKKVVKKDA